MKISIWHEYSSNNSARFTIVGVFEDSEQALSAEQILERLFEDIQDWYDEDEQRADDILINRKGISAPEEAIAKKYGIDWKEPNGWYFNFKTSIQDNVLVLSQIYGADSGAYPIDELLKKLGAQVAVDGDRVWYRDTRLGIVNVTCIAPDEEIATEIQNMYGGTITAIEDSKTVQLQIAPKHIEQTSKLFILMRKLVQKGCFDLSINVSDQKVDEHDHYELSKPYWW